MPHYLDENVTLLTRWSAVNSGPMPSDWKEFQRKSPDQALAIEAQDPQLYQLLSNQAPADLKAAALSGKLSNVAPDQAAIRQKQFQEQLQYARQRVSEGTATLTEKVWLETNDPNVSTPQQQAPGFAGPMAAAARQQWQLEQNRQALEQQVHGGSR